MADHVTRPTPRVETPPRGVVVPPGETPRPVHDDDMTCGVGMKHEATSALFAAGGSVVILASFLFSPGPTPADPNTGPGLATLQQRIRDATRKVMPSAVKIGNGSGVVISADGLILSQYHVVYKSFPEARPGSKVRVRLADGTRLEAVLLGADRLHDLAALKLTGPGPHPYCPLADTAPRLGDGVLKLGHPVGGPAEDRPPVVRFGRVLLQTDSRFICDCLINGGDSGGPFFDLDGRVRGLQGSPGIGTHWPAADQPDLQRAVAEMADRSNVLDTAHAAPFLGQRLPALTRGQIIEPTAADRAERLADSKRLSAAPALPVECWGQSRQTRAGFRRRDGSGGVVEVLGWGERVSALGTAVDPDGLVLTAAVPAVTEAAYGPDPLRCRLPGGRTVPAEVVGIDPAYNLALLRIKANRLKPVTWADGPDLPAGTLLAAVGPGGLPPAVGVVSVPRRNVSRPIPVSPPARPPASPPELAGRFVSGRGFRVEHAAGYAYDAGVRPDDLVLAVGGEPIRSARDLALPADRRRAGDRVVVQTLRDGRPVDLPLVLPPNFRNRSPLLEEFYPPVAFECDLPLLINEYGCPVVGLDGKAVGVAVGRIAPQACLIVPADTVVGRLAGLKAGKPLTAFPRVPTGTATD